MVKVFILTDGGEEHVVQKQRYGDDDEHEAARLPASLHPTAEPSPRHPFVDHSHDDYVLVESSEKRFAVSPYRFIFIQESVKYAKNERARTPTRAHYIGGDYVNNIWTGALYQMIHRHQLRRPKKTACPTCLMFHKKYPVMLSIFTRQIASD